MIFLGIHGFEKSEVSRESQDVWDFVCCSGDVCSRVSLLVF